MMMMMMMVMMMVTFEEEDLKASFDFFKMPGKTSESLLRLKQGEDDQSGNDDNNDNDDDDDGDGDGGNDGDLEISLGGRTVSLLSRLSSSRLSTRT